MRADSSKAGMMIERDEDISSRKTLSEISDARPPLRSHVRDARGLHSLRANIAQAANATPVRAFTRPRPSPVENISTNSHETTRKILTKRDEILAAGRKKPNERNGTE